MPQGLSEESTIGDWKLSPSKIHTIGTAWESLPPNLSFYRLEKFTYTHLSKFGNQRITHLGMLECLNMINMKCSACRASSAEQSCVRHEYMLPRMRSTF